MGLKSTNLRIGVAVLTTLIIFCTTLTPTQAPPSQSAGAGSPCPVPPRVFSPNYNNCSLYYSCKERFMTHQCPGNSVFSETVGACVKFNSLFDKCTRSYPKRECDARFDKNDNITITIPHPTICHLYSIYDSSQAIVYSHTCTYPDMFDMVERTCKPFKEAFCGPYRKEYKEACGTGYIRSSCFECAPCTWSYPSCVGKQNGVNAHEEKLWSHYYVYCDTERFINETSCSRNDPRFTFLFHPDRKLCVSVWEIPKEHSGHAPTCQGLAAGYHVAERPDVYFHCPEETVFYCEPGFYFDLKAETCRSPESL